MPATKPYKATSLRAAEREVRRLRKQVKKFASLWELSHMDRVKLAMLAADGPCFSNPMVAMEAKSRRDEILRTWCRLNPDGSHIRIRNDDLQ